VTVPALQQPQWADRDALRAAVRRLEGLPPLVLAAECDQLKERLASVARGEAFLLQGGDCAETFAGTTAETIRGKFPTLWVGVRSNRYERLHARAGADARREVDARG